MFAVDKLHAQSLKDRFWFAGINAGYQYADLPPCERAEIRRRFHDETMPVVVTVHTLTTGVDWDVRCLVLARPTKLEMLYVQIVGRALRRAESRGAAVILDH